jgi:hypothetical protein
LPANAILDIGLQHPESFRRVVRPLYIGRVENVAQLVTRQPIGARVPGVEIGTQLRPPLIVPRERRPVISKVARERGYAVASVCQFEDVRSDEGQGRQRCRSRAEEREIHRVLKKLSVVLRRLRIFGQQDKLRADRSKGRETWA